MPVVTDPKIASNALRNATREMEQRLKLLAQRGVRNIDQYNRTFAKGQTMSLFNNLDQEEHRPLPCCGRNPSGRLRPASRHAPPCGEGWAKVSGSWSRRERCAAPAPIWLALRAGFHGAPAPGLTSPLRFQLPFRPVRSISSTPLWRPSSVAARAVARQS
ncbi:MAG: hypothetical protein DMG29_13490 [Acidobacteria bacterium]|nr:MAG: hypothetical protein DMG29_13490 [Acidobacteriota bacterium]